MFGIDSAEGMITKARQLLPEARFYVNIEELLPSPAGSFDVVLSTSFFHHWVDQVACVREIARVLHEDGQVILADIVIPKGLMGNSSFCTQLACEDARNVCSS